MLNNTELCNTIMDITQNLYPETVHYMHMSGNTMQNLYLTHITQRITTPTIPEIKNAIIDYLSTKNGADEYKNWYYRMCKRKLFNEPITFTS